MTDIIRFEDRYYILAASPFGDDRTRVLKHDRTFGVFDRYGDILPIGLGEQGVYHDGTRILSRLTLTIEGRRPMLLSSTVVETNDLLVCDLTNPDFAVPVAGEEVAGLRPVFPRGSIHLLRSKFLFDGAMHERWRLENHLGEDLDLELGLAFEADFADIFEVRGMKRAARGELLAPQQTEHGVILSYRGLDGLVRHSSLAFSPPPAQVKGDQARLRLRLPARQAIDQHLLVTPDPRAGRASQVGWSRAFEENARALAAMQAEGCRIHTANEQFNDWINRSIADLYMLVNQTPQGIYPAAGVPWFSTIFGRDGLITAMECLWSWPRLARGVLGHLAAMQADAVDPVRDAEPGKILHESRGGEMAALHEIPFGRYYGSVDSTPLFVMLAGMYHERTADLDFARKLWPHVLAALGWIDQYGDADGDGFVEYSRRAEGGLANQGWKDSQDSVMHEDGTLAEPPIALCEVQGYVYAARRHAARLARALGEPERAEALDRQAETLRQRFDQRFWLDDLGTYALALDGDKRPCRVRSSNAGHCLWTGIALPERAARLAETLLAPDMFSGWGVRTLSSAAVRYNPMSYHNGSIWPHDNALVIAGLAAYGHRQAASTVAGALFDASLFADGHRLPELYCGFARRPGEGPTLYPVACSPQAWSAATVFSVIASLLGLEACARPAQARLTFPTLPPFLEFVELYDLRFGDGLTLDLRVDRYPNDVSTRVLRREGPVTLATTK